MISIQALILIAGVLLGPIALIATDWRMSRPKVRHR